MPAGAPGTGMASSEDGRSPYRWFAFRLAAGVPRGGDYPHRTYAPLRGWPRALARRAPARPACIIPLWEGRGQPLGGEGACHKMTEFDGEVMKF